MWNGYNGLHIHTIIPPNEQKMGNYKVLLAFLEVIQSRNIALTDLLSRAVIKHLPNSQIKICELADYFGLTAI